MKAILKDFTYKEKKAFIEKIRAGKAKEYKTINS
jgi:hypothetical protein